MGEQHARAEALRDAVGDLLRRAARLRADRGHQDAADSAGGVVGVQRARRAAPSPPGSGLEASSSSTTGEIKRAGDALVGRADARSRRSRARACSRIARERLLRRLVLVDAWAGR